MTIWRAIALSVAVHIAAFVFVGGLLWWVLLLTNSMPANASEHVPQLTLAGAEAVFGSAIRPGTMFSVGPYHFRIKRSDAHSPRPGVFVVEIETEPVP